MDLPWGFYLDWGWNPVVFFIILGLSVVLAVVVKGWQVLWVIPGFVLYGGLEWDIPTGWSFLFKLVFWVVVIVAVATAALPGPTRLARVPMYLMLGLIGWCLVLLALAQSEYWPGWEWLWWVLGIALVIGLLVLVFSTRIGAAIIAVAVVLGILNLGFGLLNGGNDNVVAPSVDDVCLTIDGEQDPAVQEEVPEGYEVDYANDCTKVAEDEEPDENAAVCPDRYVQELDPNRRFRFASEGFAGTAVEKRRQFVAALGHDFRYLEFVAEQLFKKPFDETSLRTEDKTCLTEKGQRLHAEVKGALMASGVRTGTAPADSFNTGMQNGEPVVSKRRGIFGDRTATIYTLADGTKLIVLDRCGNMVLTSKPRGVPHGPTDNQPPPVTPQPPKSTHPPKQPPADTGSGGCVEIPNNGVYDCGAKRPEDEPAQAGNVPENVTGPNPGTGGAPASQPSAQPPATYTAPPPPSPTSGTGGSTNTDPPPPRETSAPAPEQPEPSPTQDPCTVNPDWC